MTLDQHARERAAEVRRRLQTIEVPEPRAVMRRAVKRRRATMVAGVLALVAALATPVALAMRDSNESDTVQVAGGGRDGLPVGAVVNGRWEMVPKDPAGLGANTRLDATTSNGSTVLVAGMKHAKRDPVPTIWRSRDGLAWSETRHPPGADGITAISMHGDVALAIGTPGTAAAFVWRSDDAGRHWTEIARSDLFGQPVPRSRPGAFVEGLLWHNGWWVAYGGAADGYEGIWISRNGADWQTALDSGTSGSVTGIVALPDDSLMAYGLDAKDVSSALDVAWFTTDPADWGTPRPIVTPGRYSLTSVAAGATLAVAESIDRHGVTTVLRSIDAGRTWMEDDTFAGAFPNSWALTAARAGPLDVVTGTTTTRNRTPGPPRAWIAGAPQDWRQLPSSFDEPSIPTTSIPQLPPGGALVFVAPIGNRIVMLGSDPAMDRFYVFDAG